MKTINLKELKQKIDQQEQFILVNAMQKKQFNKAHIPGSININNDADMLSQLNLDDEIIVYCSSERCVDSIVLYNKLETAGYNNIARFTGGLLEWFNARFPLIEGE